MSNIISPGQSTVNVSTLQSHVIEGKVRLNKTQSVIDTKGTIIHSKIKVRRIDIVKELADTLYQVARTTLAAAEKGHLKVNLCQRLRVFLELSKSKPQEQANPLYVEKSDDFVEKIMNLTSEVQQARSPNTSKIQYIQDQETVELQKKMYKLNIELKQFKLQEMKRQSDSKLRLLEAQSLSAESRAELDKSSVAISEVQHSFNMFKELRTALKECKLSKLRSEILLAGFEEKLIQQVKQQIDLGAVDISHISKISHMDSSLSQLSEQVGFKIQDDKLDKTSAAPYFRRKQELQREKDKLIQEDELTKLKSLLPKQVYQSHKPLLDLQFDEISNNPSEVTKVRLKEQERVKKSNDRLALESAGKISKR